MNFQRSPKASDAIIDLDASPAGNDMQHYGGAVVAETIGPAHMNLLLAAPKMQAALDAFLALDPTFTCPIETVRALAQSEGLSKRLAVPVLMAREALALSRGTEP